jgi:hypothetical protein
MAVDGSVAQRIALVDVVTGLLDKGTVISGQATVSVAGVDLVHVAMNLLVSSVETLRRAGAMPPPPLLGSASYRPPSQPGGRGAPPPVPAPSPPLRGSAGERGYLSLSEPRGLGAAPPVTLATPPGAEDNGLAGLVLALVELIRQLLERQAVRRMEGGALTEEEVERMGRALMELNAKMRELFAIFGLDEADVNLDLGPLGQLL